ncbi:unnamed protein product [Gongylonema pulchrum]|uniref:Protein kinase domain-containing protein n=1 Tax=Gongylonema pulchrum TaxID=637853 RepID=A0A183E9A3_9BILA|nr:unnamed protein product [Gongylonema pulchrum]
MWSDAMGGSNEQIDLSDIHTVPDGTKDIERISHMAFIRTFISGHLQFPGEPKEYCFGFEVTFHLCIQMFVTIDVMDANVAFRSIFYVVPKMPEPISFWDLSDLGPIGEGAYGRVNKMRHNETGRYMAVKVLFVFWGIASKVVQWSV